MFEDTPARKAASGHYDFISKVVLVGDSGVGKTNLLRRYTENKFDFDSKSTIGVEFATKTETYENKILKAQIWDTAGQERFRALTSAYYRGSSGALLVFDISKKVSFDNCQRWLKDLRDNCNRNCVIILVGNKTDLENVREVKTEDAKDFAVRNQIGFLEVSACEGSNVEFAFQKLLSEIYKSVKSISLSGLNSSGSKVGNGKGEMFGIKEKKVETIRLRKESSESKRVRFKKLNCCGIM